MAMVDRQCLCWEGSAGLPLSTGLMASLRGFKYKLAGRPWVRITQKGSPEYAGKNVFSHNYFIFQVQKFEI